MTEKLVNTLPPIPNYLLQPEDWAAEATKRAAEYAGMPEGTWFLAEARRYLALASRIRELEQAAVKI